MFELIGDLSGVHIYFSDVLVCGETENECSNNLRRVLERCRQHNVKMRLSKCRFFCRELLWLGHVFATLKVDPRKVEAIKDFPDPTDKKDLIQFLGMVTYLYRFCKDLATVTPYQYSVSMTQSCQLSCHWMHLLSVWEPPCYRMDNHWHTRRHHSQQHKDDTSKSRRSCWQCYLA